MNTAITIILGVVPVLIIAKLLMRRHGRTSAPECKTTDEMMQWLAAHAVDIAEKHQGIQLDYSTESIQKVEEVLSKLHEEYVQAKPPEGAGNVAMAFGAYIGECIRRSTSGSTWDRDHPVGGEKSYPLHWLGGDSFPCTWCYNRIVNGSEDNVWHKYLIINQRSTPGAQVVLNPPENRGKPD